MENANPLRILFVEDLPSDAILAERVIRKSGLEFSSQRVDTKDAFLKALEEFRPDVIVSDYSMPEFDGMQALLLSLERDARLPFILLTGSMNEETAVKCMKAGASDYVIKEHIKRLPFAVKEALEQKKMRIAKDEAERALRDSEERYRLLAESSPEMIYLVGRDGRVTYVNSTAAAQFCMNPKEFIGKHLTEIFPPGLAEKYVHNIQEVIDTKRAYNQEIFQKFPSGEKWVETRLSPVIHESGEVLAVLGLTSDITERKLAERLTESLYEISKAIDSTDNVNELFRHIHRVLSIILQANNFFIALLSDDGKTFFFPYKSDEKDTNDWPAIGVDNAQSLIGEVLRTKGPLLLDEAELLDRYATGRNKLWGASPKCWLGVPLKIRETVIGVMSVQDYQKSSAYSQKDLTLFESAAGQIAIAIDRKRAEDALRESEHRTRTFLDSTSDMAFLKDDKFRYLFANRALCKFYGKTEHEIIRKKDFDLMSEEAALRCRKTDEQTLLSNALTVNEELIGDRCYETVKFPVAIATGKVGIGGYIRDITERKRAEEALRLQSAALEAAANAIVITDCEGAVEWVNQAFSTLTGYSLDESIGRNPRELVKSGKHDQQFYKDLWDKILAGETWRGRLINRRKDGSLYTEEQTITPLRDVNGKISHFIGIKEDVTERQRMEDLLGDSQKKFKWLYDYAPVAYHVLTPEGTITDVNVRWCESLGYSKDEVIGKPVFDFILESERSIAKASFETKKKHIASIRTKNERNYVAKDGSVKTFLVGDFVALDGQGKITSVQNTMEDITERERAAEELQASEEKYRGIFENVQDVYYEAAIEGTILELSPSIEILSKGQYHREDLIGKSMNDFYSDPGERHALLAELEARGRVTDFEIRLKNRDGSSVACSISAMIRTEDRGRPQKIMGSLRDVSARKLAERNLRLSEERFRSVWDNSADGMRLTDREGRIVDVNPAFCRLVRISREELLGKALSVVYQRNGATDDLSLYHNRFDAGKIVSNLFGSATLWNGESIDLDVSSSYIEVAGQERLLLSILRDVTEQKKSATRLEEERKLLRTIIDAIPDEICVKDTERRFVLVNPGTVRALKKSSEAEIIGKRDEDLIPEKFALLGKEEDESALISGRPFLNRVGDSRINPLTGEIERSILISKIPLKDSSGKVVGLVGINRDITEVQRANALLEKERTLLLTLIESIPDEVCLKDLAHRFLVVNTSIVRAIGARSIQDLLGKTDFDYMSPEFAQRHFDEEDALLETGQPIINLEKILLNPITGEIDKSVLTTKVPVKDSTGKNIGILVVNRLNTERKRAEEELKRSEERLRILFEYAPDAYYMIDLQGVFIDGNKAAEALTGFKKEELIGKDFFSLGLLKQDSVQKASDLLGKNAQGLASGPDDFKLIRKDGSLVEVEIRTYPVTIKNQVVVLGIARDVSQRKKADAALRDSEEKYRALFEESKDTVYISTVDGKLLDINAAGIELLGYSSKDEMLQVELTHEDYADPEHRALFIRKMEEEGFVKDFEVALRRRDGAELTVLETATAVRDKEGKIVRYRGIMRDVTKQRQLEQQFLQAQKMESIGTLAGGIAHDFNNILGIVLGHLALLERTRHNDIQFEESIYSITKAVDRGASLVRQILTFARKTDPEYEPVNINSAIKELAKLLEETFPKTMPVTVHLDKTIPVLSLDPTQLHQAFLNLCVNARDAMNGTGTLRLSTKLVPGSDVSLRFPKASAGFYVMVSVADNGPGIDDVTKRRIFEPFFTTKEKGKGTGLGLAVVYGVLQAHHGFVDVESTVGSGSTFHLFFPVPVGLVSPVIERLREQGDLPRGTETILIVEDEDILRDLLVKLLEMQGFTVIAASDGDDAVRQFNEHAKEIDLVVSDMGLPKRSGWDAIKAMQKTRTNVRALLASGFIDSGQKSEVLKSGVMGFIQKPYRMEEVLKAIRETLDAKE